MSFIQRAIVIVGFCSAIAAAAIIIPAHLTESPNEAALSWVAGLLVAVFMIVAGFREYWIIRAQRQLRRRIARSRRELASSQRRLAAVLESTTDSVLVIDRDWRVTYFNHHAAETINRRDQLAIGVSIWDLFPAALTSGEGDHYRAAFASGMPEDFEIFVEDRQIWLRIQAYPSEDGLSIFFRDISDAKQARDAMEHLAHHDPLTGVANRVVFERRLAEAVASGAEVAVLLLDLDHFKEVNDTLGHPVGDALLVGTASRLVAALPAEVTVARLGGDEFAVILVGHEGRHEVALVAQKLLAAANETHRIEGQSISVGASVGIALSSGMPEFPDELFKNADIALYAAKSDARGTFRFFETAMQVVLWQKQALRADLAGAVERGEFALAFQPLVDLRRNRVSTFEALLRWQHPRRGQVPPDIFIPIAEETGLIVAIGAWALRNAAERAMSWPDGIAVAVNLSSRQFSSGNLLETVERVLAETGLPASRLELEITESVLLRDSQANMRTLQTLRERGVNIALDDFGTGYSSLAYLQRFPFTKIKIDRAFVSGLPDSEESQAIVRSVIGLGKSLGLKVTAEGVETAAQLDWVRGGCDEAQGYYLSRPVAAGEVARVVSQIESMAAAPSMRLPLSA